MADEPIDSLLLIYNADAGRVAAFLDSARKALFPLAPVLSAS
jgi:hypothetical protein